MTDPRPLREHDTLGRAGRVSQKGNPIEVHRNRTMTEIDERATTVEVVGFGEHPRLVVTVQPPLIDTQTGELLPIVEVNEHQALLHLDGKGEPRPPRNWEDMEAARRAEVGQREREALARSLKRERAGMGLDQRIARLQHRALTMQSQRAVQTRETDARSAGPRDLAPQGEGHDAIAYASAAQVAAEWRQIELIVEKLEGYWDAHDGIAVKDVQMMTKDEKDALLTGTKLRGLHPDTIHAIYGDAIGKPRTIRWVRSQAGQNVLGLEKTERPERAA